MNYAKIKIDINKKCKKNKNIVNFTKNLIFLLEHIDYLIKNKLITQEIYIQKMYFLNEIQIKIKNLDLYINKKKYNKEITNTLVNDIYKLFQELCCYFGSSNCKNTLDIYLLNEVFLDDKDEEYIKLFNLYNEYFVPISSNKINNVENFLKIYGIKNLNLPCVISRIYDSDIHEIDELHDKINCATIIFKFDNKIICINGFFKNDSLDIIKNTTEFKNKLVEFKVNIPGQLLFAKDHAKSFEEAVDICIESLRKQILKHKEGVSQSNRREGLRERKPQAQLEHSEFGRINW